METIRAAPAWLLPAGIGRRHLHLTVRICLRRERRWETHQTDARCPGLDRLIGDHLALAAAQSAGKRDPAQQLKGAGPGRGEIGARIAAETLGIAGCHRSQKLLIEY